MLLTDVFIIENMEVLEEGNSKGPMKVRGIFQRAEEANSNRRVYPKAVLESQLKTIQPLISERRLCGELDHPQNDTVKLSNASHLVTKLEMRGNEVLGEAEILDTPAGTTAKALIKGGVKIGISSRGMGTLSEGETEGTKTVNEDFKLVTFDLVADPSTRGAYPSLSESKQYETIIQKTTAERAFITLLREELEKKSDSTGNLEEAAPAVILPVLARGAAVAGRVAAAGGRVAAGLARAAKPIVQGIQSTVKSVGKTVKSVKADPRVQKVRKIKGQYDRAKQVIGKDGKQQPPRRPYQEPGTLSSLRRASAATAERTNPNRQVASNELDVDGLIKVDEKRGNKKERRARRKKNKEQKRDAEASRKSDTGENQESETPKPQPKPKPQETSKPDKPKEKPLRVPSGRFPSRAAMRGARTELDLRVGSAAERLSRAGFKRTAATVGKVAGRLQRGTRKRYSSKHDMQKGAAEFSRDMQALQKRREFKHAKKTKAAGRATGTRRFVANRLVVRPADSAAKAAGKASGGLANVTAAALNKAGVKGHTGKDTPGISRFKVGQTGLPQRVVVKKPGAAPKPFDDPTKNTGEKK